MKRKQSKEIIVPWKSRDVWFGLLFNVVFLLLWVGLVFSLRYFSVNINVSTWMNISIYAVQIFLIAPVGWYVFHKYRGNLKSLGFRKFEFSIMGIGCSLYILLYLFLIVYAAILAHFNLRVQSSIVPLWGELSSPWPLLVGGAVLVPIIEETFFRGFVFAGFSSRYGWKKAAAISSLVFAIAHLELTFLIPAFLIGFLFAYLYQRSRSIWPGILLHFCINVIGLTATYLLSKAGPV